MFEPKALETAPSSSPRRAAAIDKNVSGTLLAAAATMTATRAASDRGPRATATQRREILILSIQRVEETWIRMGRRWRLQ